MDETMARSKALLDEIERRYKGPNNNFSYKTMMQYFSQGMDIEDYVNDISKEIEEESDDEDDDSDSSISSDDDKKQKKDDIEEDIDDSDSEDEGEMNDGEFPFTLGDNLKAKWDHRKKKLIHDISITGWLLSPVPEIRSDTKAHDGHHRNAVERLLKRWILNDVRF
jgi:hypothetical protein